MNQPYPHTSSAWTDEHIEMANELFLGLVERNPGSQLAVSAALGGPLLICEYPIYAAEEVTFKALPIYWQATPETWFGDVFHTAMTRQGGKAKVPPDVLFEALVHMTEVFLYLMSEFCNYTLLVCTAANDDVVSSVSMKAQYNKAAIFDMLRDGMSGAPPGLTMEAFQAECQAFRNALYQKPQSHTPDTFNAWWDLLSAAVRLGILFRLCCEHTYGFSPE